MGFLKKVHPFLIIAGGLLVFVLPVFFGSSLTHFSDIFAVSPWNENVPVGYFHSRAIDAVPIYHFSPSDILNRELLREGTAFTWNPYVGFGVPWLGAMQAAPYFPAKLISMLWPDYWTGQDMMLILMLLIAGAGNYLLLRSMGVGRSGAVFGALAYMLCQRLFLIIQMPTFFVECLLPLMLYAINEMMNRKSITFAMFAGAIGGIQFLGGFPESSFILGVASGSFYVWLLAREYRTAGRIEYGLLLGGIVALVTLAISGFQLAEFFKLLSASYTVHTSDYGAVVKEPFWLLPMLLPNFFGTPFVSFWATGISPHDHMPLSMFCGMSTVLLAIVALLWRTAPNRGYVWFFAILLLVFIGYDFGFPVLKNLGHLPGFNLMSTAWNVFIIPFSVSVLAGFGVQSLSHKGSSRRVALAAILYGAAVFALYISMPRAYWGGGLKAFLSVVYVVPVFAVAFVLMRRWATFRYGTHLLFGLIVLEAYLCVSAFGFLHYDGPRPATPPSILWLEKNAGHERIFGVRGIMPADTLLPYRLRDFRHLDAMYPEYYTAYAEAIWPDVRGNIYQIGNPAWTKFSDPLLDLAAVRYVVVPAATEAPAGFTPVYADKALIILRNDKAFARARYVPNILTSTEPVTPQLLKKRYDDLRTGVFVDNAGAFSRPASFCPASPSPAVEHVTDGPNEIKLKVDAPCDGFVVVADLFFPGWHATVNGRTATIYKANTAFRAVEVKAGPNEITMRYQPATWWLGGPIAGLTLAGIILAGVFYGMRRWRRLRGSAVVGSNAF